MKKYRNRKEKKWLFFTNGLLIGFSMGISVFLIAKHFVTEKLYENANQENLYSFETKTSDVIVKETKTVIHDTVAKRLKTDTNVVHTPSLPEQEAAWNDEEVEFSIQPEEKEEVLMLDRILNSKKITVKVKQNQEETPVTPPIIAFEVQQWSTPIKNSITYQNSAGILKIKGMDINLVEIFFVQGNYYLYNGTHYYTIRENKSYEKLVVSDIQF